MFALLHLGAEADPKNAHTSDINHFGIAVGAPEDQAYRRTNHPCLPSGSSVGTGEVFGWYLSRDFSGLQLFELWEDIGNVLYPYIIPMDEFFDHPDNKGTQWVPGDFDVPPQMILDMAAATRALITIKVVTPFGNYEDDFEMERGQVREISADSEDENDDAAMECIPADIGLLDKQAAIFLSDPNPAPPPRRQHQFRHPSWSLLAQLEQEAKKSGGFNWDNPNEGLPGDLRFNHYGWVFSGSRFKIFSDGEGFEDELVSAVMVPVDDGEEPLVITVSGLKNRQHLSVRWHIGPPFHPAHYNSGHPDGEWREQGGKRTRSAWRTSLDAQVMAQEVSEVSFVIDPIIEGHLSAEELQIVADEKAGYEAAFHEENPPTFYFWDCSPLLAAREDHPDRNYQNVMSMKAQMKKTIFKTTKPFKTPPVFTFTPINFVKDFLDFEFTP